MSGGAKGGIVRCRMGVECEPDEVWYQICRLHEPMERRGRLLPPESQLPGIAEDRPDA